MRPLTHRMQEIDSRGGKKTWRKWLALSNRFRRRMERRIEKRVGLKAWYDWYDNSVELLGADRARRLTNAEIARIRSFGAYTIYLNSDGQEVVYGGRGVVVRATDLDAFRKPLEGCQ